MAELKELEQYEIELEEDVSAQEELPVLTYPKARLKKISSAEKIIAVLIVLSVLALALLSVKLTTTISKAEEEITQIQQTIDEQTDYAKKLEQEKTELSRTERIKKAAEAADLEVRDENIRNVKK